MSSGVSTDFQELVSWISSFFLSNAFTNLQFLRFLFKLFLKLPRISFPSNLNFRHLFGFIYFLFFCDHPSIEIWAVVATDVQRYNYMVISSYIVAVVTIAVSLKSQKCYSVWDFTIYWHGYIFHSHLILYIKHFVCFIFLEGKVHYTSPFSNYLDA